MAVVGDAQIRITADSSNFDKDLSNQTGKAAQSAAKGMVAKAGKVLAVGLAATAATVGAATGVILGSALNKGFARLNAIEQAEAKLGVLLKSTKNVEVAMKAANAAVTGTAFGMGEAATAAASLASANVPLSGMERTLTLVADSATVGGTSLTEMASIFSKVSSNGKVTTEVLNQFGDRGIGATKALADQLGVTQEAVRQMVTDGKIDFETFQKAMETMVGGAAQAAGTTVQGSMANVGAALSRLGEAMLKPVFERLPEVFTNIQGAIVNVTGAVRPLANIWGGTFAEMLVSSSEWLVETTRIFGEVGRLVEAVFGKPAGTALEGSIAGVTAAADPAISAVDRMAAGLEAASRSKFIGFIERTREVLTLARDSVTVFYQALTGGSEVGEFEGALGLLNDAGATLGEWLSTTSFTELLSSASPLFSAIKGALPSVIEFGRAIGGSLLAAARELTPLLSLVSDAAFEVGAALGDALIASLPGVSDLLNTLVTELLPPMVTLLEAVVPPAVKLVTWLVELAGALAGNEKVLLAVVGTLGTVKLGFMLADGAIRAASISTRIATAVMAGYKGVVAGAKWLLFLGQYAAENAKQIAIQTWAWIKDKAQIVAHKAAAAGSWLLNMAKQIAGVVWQLTLSAAAWFKDKLQIMAHKAVAAGSWLVTMATNLGRIVWQLGLATLAWIKDTAQMAIHKGAMIASAAATQGLALAQKLLNAAMKANPIGLIITAVTLLIGGIIALWKNSETFRNIVLAVWDAVKKAIAGVADWFMNTALPIIRGAWEALQAGFQSLWTTVQRVWQWIKDAVSAGISFIVNLFMNWTGPGLLIKHWDTIMGAFSKAWTWIKGTFAGWWDGLLGILSKPVNLAKSAIDTALSVGSGVLSYLNKAWTWVKNTFSTMWNGLLDVLKSPIDKAKAAIDTILGEKGIRGAFSSAVEGIGKIWDGIKDVVKKPINWVIRNVINPFMKNIKPILTAVGLGSLAGKLGTVKEVGFKDGGWTGPGPRNKAAGVVHADEHVWTKEEMRKFPGGHGAMARLRAAIKAGVPLHGSLHGYATGGRVVNATGRRHTSGYPWATWAGDFPAPMGAPVMSWKDGVVSLVRHLTTSYGKHLRINHDDGTSSLYAHLSRILAFVGQRVMQGQKIGEVGSTGNSTGPHLHFESMGGPFRGGGALSGSATATTPSILDIGRMIQDAVGKFIKRKASGGGIFGDIVNAVPGKILDGVIDKAKSMLGFQNGGVMPWDGRAWLSEDGRPELVVGPQRGAMRRGSRVFDADETARMMGGNVTNNYDVSLNVNLDDVRDIGDLIRFLENYQLAAHRSR